VGEALLKPSKRLRVAKGNHKPYSKSYKSFLWKESERQLGDFILAHDDPHPSFSSAVSSRGRVGHITGLGFDGITKKFVWENKKREKAPTWLIEPIVQVLEKASANGLDGILSLDIQQELKENKLSMKRLPRLFILTDQTLAMLLDLAREIDG